jgi:hypothetical protein
VFYADRRAEVLSASRHLSSGRQSFSLVLDYVSDYANDQLGTLLRSKRKIEELSNVIQEQRRQAGH